MRFSELAYRYASSLYEVAREEKTETVVFSQLKEITKLLLDNADVRRLIESPLALPAEKGSLLSKALQGDQINKSVRSFLLLLAKKDRLTLLEEIASAYEQKLDETQGVTRGTVKSGSELTDVQKKEIENKISSVVGKKVVLSYSIDPKLHGGLSAQVGSYIFDDSLSSHLTRIQEDLNRRIH